MMEFIRQLALGAAIMVPTLTALGLVAALSEDHRGQRGSGANADVQARTEDSLRALRERGMMLEQLNHAQRLHNMSNDAMWRSFYQQQDMIRAR
jgi:hypothetical protein